MTSPSIRSGVRLVARMLTPAVVSRSRVAQAAAASITCSQLSSVTTTWSPRMESIAAIVGWLRLPSPARPRARSTAGATAAESRIGARSIHTTARLWNLETISYAIRVLPQPPGPVRVNSREAERSRRSAVSSLFRPTKVVCGIGVPMSMGPKDKERKKAGPGQRKGPALRRTLLFTSGERVTRSFARAAASCRS